jgi:hypothetical protein
MDSEKRDRFILSRLESTTIKRNQTSKINLAAAGNAQLKVLEAFN